MRKSYIISLLSGKDLLFFSSALLLLACKMHSIPSQMNNSLNSGHHARKSKPINQFLENAMINDAPLAITIRGHDDQRPLLIIIHGGPGYAMIDLFHTKLPELEDSFVVVNFDQRGAGLSYSKNLPAASLTLAQLVEDTHDVRQLVLNKLNRTTDKRVFVLGHSMGTMIGLDLVKKYPLDYAAFIGVGQTVNIVENEQVMYDHILVEAQSQQNAKAISELLCIGRPLPNFKYSFPKDGTQNCDAKKMDAFKISAKWMGFFGGDVFGETSTDKIDNEILGSKLYANKAKQWIDGLKFSDNLFKDPLVEAWDATTLHSQTKIPLYFMMGKHDFDTPAPLVEKYAQSINGPHKLIWFEKSAHFPFYEEKDEFIRQLLLLTKSP